MKQTVHENVTIKPGKMGLSDFIDYLIEIDKYFYHADYTFDTIIKVKTPIEVSGYRYATNEELDSVRDDIFDEEADYYG